eukprot:4703276-Pleurochrysis_carterae.AAC.1
MSHRSSPRELHGVCSCSNLTVESCVKENFDNRIRHNCKGSTRANKADREGTEQEAAPPARVPVGRGCGKKLSRRRCVQSAKPYAALRTQHAGAGGACYACEAVRSLSFAIRSMMKLTS